MQTAEARPVAVKPPAAGAEQPSPIPESLAVVEQSDKKDVTFVTFPIVLKVKYR